MYADWSMLKSSAPAWMPLIVSGRVSKPPAWILPARPLPVIRFAQAAVLPASTAYRPAASGVPENAAVIALSSAACWAPVLIDFTVTPGAFCLSALVLMAVSFALAMVVALVFSWPVDWGVGVPGSLGASASAGRVGMKNELVVTWLMNTNRHPGVVGKLPAPPPEAELLPLLQAE